MAHKIKKRVQHVSELLNESRKLRTYIHNRTPLDPAFKKKYRSDPSYFIPDGFQGEIEIIYAGNQPDECALPNPPGITINSYSIAEFEQRKLAGEVKDIDICIAYQPQIFGTLEHIPDLVRARTCLRIEQSYHDKTEQIFSYAKAGAHVWHKVADYDEGGVKVVDELNKSKKRQKALAKKIKKSGLPAPRSVKSGAMLGNGGVKTSFSVDFKPQGDVSPEFREQLAKIKRQMEESFARQQALSDPSSEFAESFYKEDAVTAHLLKGNGQVLDEYAQQAPIAFNDDKRTKELAEAVENDKGIPHVTELLQRAGANPFASIPGSPHSPASLAFTMGRYKLLRLFLGLKHLAPQMLVIPQSFEHHSKWALINRLSDRSGLPVIGSSVLSDQQYFCLPATDDTLGFISLQTYLRGFVGLTELSEEEVAKHLLKAMEANAEGLSFFAFYFSAAVVLQHPSREVMYKFLMRNRHEPLVSNYLIDNPKILEAVIICNDFNGVSAFLSFGVSLNLDWVKVAARHSSLEMFKTILLACAAGNEIAKAISANNLVISTEGVPDEHFTAIGADAAFDLMKDCLAGGKAENLTFLKKIYLQAEGRPVSDAEFRKSLEARRDRAMDDPNVPDATAQLEAAVIMGTLEDVSLFAHGVVLQNTDALALALLSENQLSSGNGFAIAKMLIETFGFSPAQLVHGHNSRLSKDDYAFRYAQTQDTFNYLVSRLRPEEKSAGEIKAAIHSMLEQHGWELTSENQMILGPQCYEKKDGTKGCGFRKPGESKIVQSAYKPPKVELAHPHLSLNVVPKKKKSKKAKKNQPKEQRQKTDAQPQFPEYDASQQVMVMSPDELAQTSGGASARPRPSRVFSAMAEIVSLGTGFLRRVPQMVYPSAPAPQTQQVPPKAEQQVPPQPEPQPEPPPQPEATPPKESGVEASCRIEKPKDGRPSHLLCFPPDGKAYRVDPPQGNDVGDGTSVARPIPRGDTYGQATCRLVAPNTVECTREGEQGTRATTTETLPEPPIGNIDGQMTFGFFVGAWLCKGVNALVRKLTAENNHLTHADGLLLEEELESAFGKLIHALKPKPKAPIHDKGLSRALNVLLSKVYDLHDDFLELKESSRGDAWDKDSFLDLAKQLSHLENARNVLLKNCSDKTSALRRDTLSEFHRELPDRQAMKVRDMTPYVGHTARM